MERDLIDWLSTHFPAKAPVRIGIGDDAAVLRLPPGELVATTDAIVDGVHFDARHHPWEQIGHKAIGVNLSDLAAMGATPCAALVTLVLPREASLQQVQRMYDGIRSLSDRWGIVLAGGDTNFASSPLAISVTALGMLPPGREAWQIGGAQSGDAILVSGRLGGSILGKHLGFEPRCDLVRDIGSRYSIHAATDISDGLLFNLDRILRASKCGAEIDLDSIPLSEAAHQLSSQSPDGQSPLEHGLYDGEDFELILVVGDDDARTMLQDPLLMDHLTRIGRVRQNGGISGRTDDGSATTLRVRGYVHGQAAS
jgi:thiamine-monophosphate kinase